VEEADQLLQKMKKEGVTANAVTYNSLIDGYCKERNMEKALEVCSEMTKIGIEPNIITFSTLIDAYCKMGNMEAAMGLYSEMVVKGLLPDIVAYTALIDGHFKMGKVREANRLHKEMVEAGLAPNVFTLSCLVDGLGKNGKASDAINLFLEKTEVGSPNHVTYTALIQGLCVDNRIFEATKFYLDMRVSGLRPDAFTYIVMLKGHYQAKHTVGVRMLHADMIKMGIVPSAGICPVLYRAYQEIGDPKSAATVF
jgi:pentatricopeptide repeat protein